MNKWTMYLLLTGLICSSASIALCEQTPAPPKVITALSDGLDGPDTVALRNRLTVTVTNLSSLLAQAKSAKKPVVLYLNGIALNGIEPEAMDTNKNQLRFHLVRSEEGRKAWAALLGDPRFEKKVSVSVGLEGEVPMETEVEKFRLVVIRLVGFWLFVAAVGGLTLWLWKKQTTTEMLRDPGPEPPVGEHRPYSLAKVQMAIWFWLTVTSFLFIFLLTYTFDTIPTSVFVLMGISAATGLGAVVQDSTKKPDEGLDELEKEHRELEAIADGKRIPEQQKRLLDVENLIKWYREPTVSEGFLKDILTDAQGTSFHRLQMFIWTLVLAFMFGWEVYHNLAMPDFNNSLLALMGISSGTYIGFMIPEKHSSQQQA
jgi:hypothetical protein